MQAWNISFRAESAGKGVRRLPADIRDFGKNWLPGGHGERAENCKRVVRRGNGPLMIQVPVHVDREEKNKVRKVCTFRTRTGCGGEI